MPDIDRIRALTAKALDEFDSPGKSTSALVRQAHRIAVLRHDYAVQVWFVLQQRDLQASKNQMDDLLAIKAKLIALLGMEAGNAEYMKQALAFEASRMMLHDKNMSAMSVDQIEVHIAHLEEVAAEREIPTNLHSFDAGLALQRQENARNTVLPTISSLKNILARVRQGTHNYLVDTESELDAGRDESSFFDRVYVRINTLLGKYAPEAAVNFVAAQERITGGGPEDISHALTSCRRMIKSLADALYPPTGKDEVGLDGVVRTMSDDSYRNRLLQYVREQVGKHKSGDMLQSIIGDLGKRLNALDALASKGVHASPSLDEAHTCVVQTYLLAGDLLAIAEETSLLMRGDDGEPAAADGT